MPLVGDAAVMAKTLGGLWGRSKKIADRRLRRGKGFQGVGGGVQECSPEGLGNVRGLSRAYLRKGNWGDGLLRGEDDKQPFGGPAARYLSKGRVAPDDIPAQFRDDGA